MSRPVLVEVVRLSALPWPDRLGYRVVTGALDAATPDDAARGLCPDDVEALHSTSWRALPDGTLVLTYAALPCGDAADDVTPLLGPAVVCSGDPLVPAPPQVHAHHVAAHAVRHLAYLVERDPGVGAAARASRDPGLWAAVVTVSLDMPTGTHDAAHRAAARLTTDRVPPPA